MTMKNLFLYCVLATTSTFHGTTAASRTLGRRDEGSSLHRRMMHHTTSGHFPVSAQQEGRNPRSFDKNSEEAPSQDVTNVWWFRIIGFEPRSFDKCAYELHLVQYRRDRMPFAPPAPSTTIETVVNEAFDEPYVRWQLLSPIPHHVPPEPAVIPFPGYGLPLPVWEKERLERDVVGAMHRTLLHSPHQFAEWARTAPAWQAKLRQYLNAFRNPGSRRWHSHYPRAPVAEQRLSSATELRHRLEQEIARREQQRHALRDAQDAMIHEQ